MNQNNSKVVFWHFCIGLGQSWDHLDEVLVVPGDGGQKGDLGVCPARAVALVKVRDHLDEAPVVPGGPDGHKVDLDVSPARAVVLDKVRDHLDEVPVVPARGSGWRPGCWQGGQGQSG